MGPERKKESNKNKAARRRRANQFFRQCRVHQIWQETSRKGSQEKKKVTRAVDITPAYIVIGWIAWD